MFKLKFELIYIKETYLHKTITFLNEVSQQ